MTNIEKVEACKEFFNSLSKILESTYEVVASCNQDISKYLIPKGTIGDLTYHSKPDASFRISDHWNWYSNLKKCPNPNYIQCLSVDMPRAKKRPDYGKASKPIDGIQVSVIGKDGKYHAVYGEIFDRKTKKWNWLETDPADIAEMVCA